MRCGFKRSVTMYRLGSARPSVRGSALIVVLWVVTLMGIMVGSFAFDSHVEARITSYYRKRTKADYLARSGLEIAKVVMAKSALIQPWAIVQGEGDDDRWFVDARRLRQGDGVTIVESLGAGKVEVTIASERALRNVNYLLTEEDWEPVLEVADIPQPYWPELIESFLDWRDEDEVPRVDGAETKDYYGDLDPPYRARNGPLFTVDELLLIKGFTAPMLYGGRLDPADDASPVVSGMADILTVFGDAKINANSASRRVMMTLPDPFGNADLVSEGILRERAGETRPEGDRDDSFFRDDNDLFTRVPEAGMGPRRAYITTESSQFFRITSVGDVEGVRRTITSIVQLSGEEFRILRWSEDG